ncbi:MAG: endopeptidase [Armatimonadetes bacterium]|jgi:Zn-dependent protease with chaperone function|nr:endopeptidase [Armatimonadota bacterium]
MQAAIPGANSFSIDLPDSEERLCRQYGRSRFALNLVEFGVLFGVLLLLTFTGGARSLLSMTRGFGEPRWAGDLVYLLVIGIIVRAVQLPAHFLGEHWLERRYGLSSQTLWQWAAEWLTRSAVLGLVTLLLLFAVTETLRWWMWVVLPWSLAFLFGRNLFYDWIYYPLQGLFYPVHFLRRESFELPGLGRRTLPVYQVQVSHRTRRANASIRLRGPRTAIYVTDTLIDEFTDGEERVVMAHEFGHLYDHLHLETRTRAGIAQAQRKLKLGSAQLLAGLASLLLVQLFGSRLGLQGAHDLAAIPLMAALTLFLGRTLDPLLCEAARKDEQDADEYALRITGDVPNYVSVMRKLRWMNLEESTPNPLSRFLFDTHPSYSERVDLAKRYRRRHQSRKGGYQWRGWRAVQRHGRR